MRKDESLFANSPFAHDPTAYQKYLVDSVATSTAIENGPVPRRLMSALKKHSRRPQNISLRLKSAKGF
jgi:hypothetical protein